MKSKSVTEVWRQDLQAARQAELLARAQRQTTVKAPKTASRKLAAVTLEELEVVLTEFYRLNPGDEGLTFSELLPKLNSVLAANQQKTSASQVKKCGRYRLACESTGRGRKKPEITQQRHRREPIEMLDKLMLDKLMSQQNREIRAGAGERVRGQVVLSRD